ncbi:hypothetical protein CCR75_002884 [Bremia lactucae]|uniref:Uncharacterized protein n=1 Tax=Bremia lactucae TaxID=4779 RepID=A0A976IF87_BRELC|nr:hypothetical protein CCR75_002884 [Bremia lactucae]
MHSHCTLHFLGYVHEWTRDFALSESYSSTRVGASPISFFTNLYLPEERKTSFFEAAAAGATGSVAGAKPKVSCLKVGVRAGHAIQQVRIAPGTLQGATGNAH